MKARIEGHPKEGIFQIGIMPKWKAIEIINQLQMQLTEYRNDSFMIVHTNPKNKENFFTNEEVYKNIKDTEIPLIFVINNNMNIPDPRKLNTFNQL